MEFRGEAEWPQGGTGPVGPCPLHRVEPSQCTGSGLCWLRGPLLSGCQAVICSSLTCCPLGEKEREEGCFEVAPGSGGLVSTAAGAQCSGSLGALGSLTRLPRPQSCIPHGRPSRQPSSLRCGPRAASVRWVVQR